MTGRALSRRAFLRRAGVGAAGVAIGGPTLLAACSKSDAALHEVRVYNEPLAIDDATQALFEKASGVFLRYHEYDDAAAYVDKSAAGLKAHRDIGADVVVVPDQQAALMIESGWVRTLPDRGARKRVLPAFANPRFDPGRKYSLPYSATMIGLAYDRRFVKSPVNSVEALFDPKFAGKVALSANATATLGLVALAAGNDPAKITEAQAGAAVDRVERAVSSGQVRSFATTEYVDDLVSGRAAIAVARADEIKDALVIWPKLTFVVPVEGGLLESTNMVVPAGARNVDEARDFITFMFRPEPVSRVSSYFGRVMPVEGGVEALQKIDVRSAFDPRMVPADNVWPRLSIWGGPPDSAAAAAFTELAASHPAPTETTVAP